MSRRSKRRQAMLNRNEAKKLAMLKSEAINDQLTVRKGLFPLWIFADVHHGKFVKHNYWCFVGCNYPDGIQSYHEDVHQKALTRLADGTFAAEAKKDYPDTKQGWGNGESPDEAFKEAVKMAGYFAVTKGGD